MEKGSEEVIERKKRSVSIEVFCIKATIDMRLSLYPNDCVALLLSPKEAKELSEFINELMNLDWQISKMEDGREIHDIHLQR